jgi:hypothetical protein
MKVRGIVALTLSLAFSLVGLTPSQAQQADPSEYIRRNPMVFFVADGSDGSCGPGCNQWIAADGAFDSGAHLRFREFLDKLQRTDLPVYFNSGGGIAGPSITIGLMLHERRMTAGVARTVPFGCADVPRLDEDCRRRKMLSGENVRSWMRESGAVCASGCVLALIGAPTRKVAPVAKIGVHAHRSLYDGDPKMLSALGIDRDPQAVRLKLKLYAAQMGTDYRFVDVAEDTPASSMHWMTREEVSRFNIATTGPFETEWLTYAKPNIGYFVLKSLSRPVASRSGAFETVTLELGCSFEGAAASLTLRRLLDAAEAKGSTSVQIAAGGSTVFEDERGVPPGPDVRSKPLRLSEIRNLVTANEIVMTESSEAGPRQTRFSTEGLRTALAIAPRACRLAR